jgi:uncharacterized protein (DUF305 family)
LKGGFCKLSKSFFIGFVSVLAIVVLSAACGQTANNEHSTMNHNSMNHNGMNHNSMPATNHNSIHAEMKSDPDAAAQAYDLQFIDTMAHHHAGAVEMSGLALKKSQNEELKKFAQKIIDDQEREISQLKEWRGKWFAGKTSAVNMEMPGMADSMRMMTGGGMAQMEAASGKDFDLLFLELMSDHHQGALVMATDAEQKAEHAEIKTLAGQIIKAQQEEIKKMSDWRAQWAK